MRRGFVFRLVMLGALTGCTNTSLEGLLRTPPGDGPRVRYEPEARPLPEIPLPNDIATRSDPTSVTGRRVNVSTLAPTSSAPAMERILDLRVIFSASSAAS